MKKNIFLLFLALCSFSAIHAAIDWNLDDDGTFTISGSGEMDDYLYWTTPWYNDREKIKKVVIEEGVTSIGNCAFYGCKNLTSVTTPNSVTNIGIHAFAVCSSLTSITIPNSVTRISELAFAHCSSLTSVEIPNSVKSIGEAAFVYTALTSIIIPNSVTSIGRNAFSYCSSLTSVTFKGSTPPELEFGAFYQTEKISVYVPTNRVEAYKKELEGWGFSNIQANPKLLCLADDEAYTRGSETDGMEASYTRNFTNTKWQAIYLPFSLKYDDWKDDFDMAYINAVRQYDNNQDDVIDETVIEIVKMKSGSTMPNMPYLIRAKTTGEKTISVENATVYAAEENNVDCSTTIAKYTFTGTYNRIPYEILNENNFYAMGGGELVMSNGSDLKPFRWFMKVESRSSRYNMSNAAKAISLKVMDEESETTGVEELRITNCELPNYELPVYDLNGRKVNENNLKPGMYIKNGRKFVVK